MGRPERLFDPVVALALLATVPLAYLAASPHRVLAVGIAAGLTLVAGLFTWASHDAPGYLAGLWLFQLVRWPLNGTLPLAAAAAVNQLTDLALVVLVAAFAWQLLGPDAPRRDLRFLLPALGLAVFGALSSVVHRGALTPSVVGLWLAVKLWILVGLTFATPWRRDDVDRVLGVVETAGALVAVLGILDFATHGAVATALHSNVSFTDITTYRAGAAQAVYGTPNEFNLSMSLLAALSLARVAGGARGREVVYAALFVAAAVVSLRLKAVLSLAAVLAIITTVLALRGRRGALAMLVAGALGFAAIYAFVGPVLRQQVTNYRSTQATARSDLYRVSLEIARADAPLGAGFGRFGSAPSRDHYSAVYDEYGLSRVWGLTRQFPRFIADLSWPAILGETGYGGLAAYVLGLAGLAALALSRLRRAADADLAPPLALLCVLAVIVVDSSGNSTLFSWTTASVLAIAVGATLAPRASEPPGPGAT